MNYEEVLGPRFVHLLHNPGVQKLIHAFETQVQPSVMVDSLITDHDRPEQIEMRAQGAHVGYIASNLLRTHYSSQYNPLVSRVNITKFVVDEPEDGDTDQVRFYSGVFLIGSMSVANFRAAMREAGLTPKAPKKPLSKADQLIFERRWDDGRVYIKVNGHNVAYMERERFMSAIKACPWEKLYETRTEVHYERSPQDADAMAALQAEVRDLQVREGKVVNDAVKKVTEKLEEVEKTANLAHERWVTWRQRAKQYHRQMRLMRNAGGLTDTEIVAQNERLREEKEHLFAQVNRLQTVLQQEYVTPDIPIATSFEVIGNNNPISENHWVFLHKGRVLCRVPVKLFDRREAAQLAQINALVKHKDAAWAERDELLRETRRLGSENLSLRRACEDYKRTISVYKEEKQKNSN